MKKLIIISLIAVLAISLCACGKNKNSGYDKEDQLREQIGQLEDEYDNAKQKSDQFKHDVSDYYDALNDLDKYN